MGELHALAVLSSSPAVECRSASCLTGSPCRFMAPAAVTDYVLQRLLTPGREHESLFGSAPDVLKVGDSEG